MAEEQRQILIDVELENRDFEQELGNVNKQLKANRDTIKELNKDYQNNAKEIAKLELANKDLSAQKREIIKDQKTEANSLNALRRQLAKLTAERNNLDTSLEGNAQKFQELQDEILQTTTKIKGFEQAGGDFRRNVGNYTASVQEALAASGSFGQGIVGLGGQVQGLFTLIKANPIGILITAVTALIGLFARSKVATEALEVATNSFNAILQVSVDTVAKFGKSIGFLLDGEFAKAWETAAEAAGNYTKNVSEAFNAQQNLTGQLQKLRTEQINLQIAQSETLKREEELKNIRDNELLSLDKRIAANEELSELQLANLEKQLQNRKAILEAETTLLLAGRDRQDLQDTELQKLADLTTAYNEFAADVAGRQNEVITNRFQLLRERTENQLRLSTALIDNELATLEDGNQRKLDLELQLIEKRRQLLIEAAGEDATILAAINQEADNERLEKFRAFQENQVQLETVKSKKVEGITEEETQNRLKNIGKSIAATVDANKLEIEDDRKTKEIKAQLEAQLLNNTLSILGSIDESGKASALLQIGLSAAQGVAAAVKAGAGVPFPGNLAAIGAGVSSVLAAIGQARQIFSQSAGAGSGASGSGSAPRVNTGLVSSEGGGNIGLINAGLLSQFSEPLRSEQRTAQSTANAVSNLGPIFVAVTDINKGQRRLNAKVTEARLG